jgi:transposase
VGAPAQEPDVVGQRSRIVLACADGLDNVAVAERLGVNEATVGKWRRRFVAKRLDGLVDEPRPGAPRTISDDDVERVIVTTLEAKPVDATHWTTRDLAAKVGMSPASVGRIWQAFGLKPWQTDTFKLSEDPLFIDKVRDIVGLYARRSSPQVAARRSDDLVAGRVGDRDHAVWSQSSGCRGSRHTRGIRPERRTGATRYRRR